MILALAVSTLTASAQFYVGGNLGVASTKIAGGDNETTYKVLPEVGYNFNDNWAIGTVIGWGKGTPVSIEDATEAVRTFEVAPYARFTFVKNDIVNVFVDGGFMYRHYNGLANQWNIGLKPGIAVHLGKSFDLVARAGFLGYKTVKGTEDGAKANNAWGVDLDANDISFGLYFNF